jgi:hypothetical protein
MKIQLLFALFLLISFQLNLVPAEAQALNGTNCALPGSGDGPTAPSQELQPWFSETKKHIESAFLLEPHASEIRVVRCTFKVSSEGAISDISYWCRERNKEHNECAMRIIKASSPLPPLPKDVQWSQKVMVDFEDSKVYLSMMIKNTPQRN